LGIKAWYMKKRGSPIHKYCFCNVKISQGEEGIYNPTQKNGSAEKTLTQKWGGTGAIIFMGGIWKP